jgi:hypothetical protein
MKRHGAYHAITFAAALSAALMSGLKAPFVHAESPSPTVSECEGEACPQVTLTFDEAKQQYLVHNNSAERWVRVSAANVAASADACVAPAKTKALPLRSIAGGYRADYTDSSCGASPGE